jgi:hypothetical protein
VFGFGYWGEEDFVEALPKGKYTKHFLYGFGITVGYHRLLAHRTFKLNGFVEHF